MSIHIEKGDYLIFAAIATTCGYKDLPFAKCEIEPGVWRRHWELQEHESRSDISRDGYMGVILYAVVNNDRAMISRIIKAGWRRRWTMGDRGKSDYINIWPLIPTLYAARYGRWIPTLPTLIIKMNSTGFRAHLMALNILTEMLMGKRKWIHRYSTKKLIEANPDNPWFRALYNVAHRRSQDDVVAMMLNFNFEEAAYGWGSCPGEVMHALVVKTMKV